MNKLERVYFAITGMFCLAFTAAALASFWRFCDLTFRRYAKSNTNRSSILKPMRVSFSRIQALDTIRAYLSLVIINSPCTSRPFVICGAIPLKSPSRPSCSTIYFITSTKLLKGLPSLAGGGLDCSPTFATIRGCVAMVASALDIAPSTDAHISR